MLTVHEQHAKRKLVATIISVVVVAGCVIFIDNMKLTGASSANSKPTVSVSADPTTSPASTAASATTPSPSSASSSGFKDGSYTASMSYYVPHGNESIQVSLKLASGVISDVSIQNSEGDNESARYQQDFASAYKSYVVGRKISGLNLDVIAGASDTTQGFNDAISRIVTKAQA